MVVSCFVFMLICAVIARASYETRDRLHQKRLETGELEGRLGNAWALVFRPVAVQVH